MSGNYTRQRGYAFENEVRKFFDEGGLACRRHFMSGMYEKGDLSVTSVHYERELKGQCKRKKALPAWITDELEGHDFIIMREDRGKAVVVITAEMFRDLLQ